ncbi:lipopolysaccharide biosynthesis protein [Angustibacter sp. McL0619]|uniref:lipopolysaccharide biosynthesis protein n=1 Tax=Angustibacter sp. McL0619 TaxID=3415676 RepID=UPI003CEB787B
MSKPVAADASRADLRALGRGSAINFVGAGLAGVAGFVMTVLVTRTQSPVQAGVYFVATSLFVVLAGMARMGSGVGAVYWIARLRAQGHDNLLAACVRAGLWPVAIVSVVIAVALAVAAPSLGRLLAPQQAPAVATALRQLSALFPFAVLLDVLLAATRGFGTMRPTFVVERVLRQALQLTLVAVACLFVPRLLPLLWALAWLPTACLAWVQLRRLVRRAGRRAEASAADQGPPEAAEDGAGVAEDNAVLGAGDLVGSSRGEPQREYSTAAYWSFCAPRGVTTLVQTALLRMDVLLVSAMLGAGSAALYAASTRFLIFGQLVTQAISMAVGPQLARLLAAAPRSETNVVYRLSTAWLVLTAWPVYLVCALFAPVILSVFGRSYQEGVPVTVMLALTMLFATACGLTDVVLTMAGRARWNLANRTLALVVNIAVDLLLIPRWGIMGAATGWACAIVVSNLLPVVQLRRSLGLSPWGRSTTIALLLSGVCFGFVPGVVRVVMGANWPAVSGALLLGGMLYLGGLWRWREVLRLEDMLAIIRRRPRSNSPIAAGR